VIKRPTESFPPSLPLAVAAPVPELSAADATSAAKTADLHSLVFSLSNRATRRRRIIATAKGGTGTDGRTGGGLEVECDLRGRLEVARSL